MRQPKYILVHLLNLRLRDGDAASLRFDHLPCSSLVSLGAVAVTVWGTVTARGAATAWIFADLDQAGFCFWYFDLG